MTKLTNTKMKWIVRKSKKRLPIKDIADAMNISIRRVQQIIKRYKLTNVMPALTKSRRPKTQITDEQKNAINIAFEDTKLSARLLYYELKNRRIPVPKNKLYCYMKEKGWVIPNPKLQKQRK